MGRDKADVAVGDKTMLERCVASLSPVVDEVVLLGADRAGYTCWPDAIHGSGPLAGIATALSRHEGSHVFVVAVDQPFVRSETVNNLIDLADGLPVVPVDADGVRQVTCAVYPTATAITAKEETETGGSIQSYLDAVSFEPVPPETWAAWGEDGRSWFSIDAPEALTEAIGRFR